MCTTDNISPVIPIKNLVNQDSEPSKPHKLETGMEPSVSKVHILFCLCVLQNATAHMDTNALNMRHKSQNVFWVIFVRLSQHQKGYLIYVPSTLKIVSWHGVVSDKTFSSALAYKSHQYSEELATWPTLLYIPYATSSNKQTGNILTFGKFEDGNLVYMSIM